MSPSVIQRGLCAAAMLIGAAVAAAAAQELEPGAYQNAPVGFNVVFAGYGYSTGNILVDAAMPIEGANAKLHAVSVGYLRTLNLFGRLAKADVQVPVSSARFEGFVDGEFRTRSPKGLADPRVRLSVNLLGSPALRLPEFAKFRQRTILGASVQMTLPLGQYDNERLVNLGANRWGIRPEVALSHARARWVFEAAGGVWFFTDNKDYFPNATLSQQPLSFAKVSAIYSFRRNLWASASYGRATGGETEVDGRLRNDLQRNDRVAGTLSMPLSAAAALRVVFTSGLTTRLGADFDSIAVAYQYSWSSSPRPAK